MSLSIVQQFEHGKWQSALILGGLIRFYWRQPFGTEWMAAEKLRKVEHVEQANFFKNLTGAEIRDVALLTPMVTSAMFRWG